MNCIVDNIGELKKFINELKSYFEYRIGNTRKTCEKARTLSISAPLSPGKPPPMSISCMSLQPIDLAIAINRLHIPMPLLNAFNSLHGLPTWKLKPYKVRPRSIVSCISRTASSSGSQPNFNPRAQSEFFASHRIRITILLDRCRKLSHDSYTG